MARRRTRMDAFESALSDAFGFPRPRRTSRYLQPLDAMNFIEINKGLRENHARLTAEGYALTPKVRPYLTKVNDVTFRFVWRKRSDGLTETWTTVLRIPLGAIKAVK